jgi:hypothetical protein
MDEPRQRVDVGVILRCLALVEHTVVAAIEKLIIGGAGSPAGIAIFSPTGHLRCGRRCLSRQCRPELSSPSAERLNLVNYDG